MSILDDARPGFDHSVRPQDDLFGHVNGTWLATEEIPSDRSSWGPFVTLADRIRWTSAARCHVGLVRDVNEDAFLDRPERGLWVGDVPVPLPHRTTGCRTPVAPAVG